MHLEGPVGVLHVCTCTGLYVKIIVGGRVGVVDTFDRFGV